MSRTTVRISILGDASSLKKATAEAGTAIGQLENSFGGVAGKMAAAFGTAVVGKFALNAVNAASSIQESLSKLNVLVGESSEALDDWAKTTARGIGISRKASLEALGTFANLFGSLNKGSEETARMSKEMVQLAGDMASFNNASIAETLTAIEAGLRGEALPLRRFGVLLDDATLKERAFSMGIRETTTGVLPPAIRLQAAYAEIIAQTSKQQGDYQRTSHLLANQTRTLSAEFEDLQAELGEQMYPAALKVVGALRDALPVFETLADQAIGVGQSLGPIADGLATATIGIGTFAAGAGGFTIAAGKVADMTTKVIALRTAAGTLGGAFGILGAIFTGAVAVGLLTSAARAAETKRTTDELTEALRAQEEPTQVMVDKLSALVDELTKVKGAQEDATEAVEEFGLAAVVAKAGRDDTSDSFRAIGVDANALTDQVNSATDAFVAASSAMGKGLDPAGARTMIEMSGAADQLTQSQRAFLESMIEGWSTGKITRDQFQAMIGTLGALSGAYVRNREALAQTAKEKLKAVSFMSKEHAELVRNTHARHANTYGAEHWIVVAEEVTKKLDEERKATQEATGATDGLEAAQAGVIPTAKNLSEVIAEQTKRFREQQEALIESFSKELAYEKQQVKTKEAIEKVGTALAEKDAALASGNEEEAAAATKVFEDAILDAKDEMLSEARLAHDIAKNMAEVTGETDPAAVATAAFVGKLRELNSTTDDPRLNAWAAETIAQMELLAWGFEAAKGKAAELIGLLRSNNISDVAAGFAQVGMPLDLLPTGTPAATPAANGGPVTAGQTYLVGERGPELFTSSRNGQIIPNDELGGGGGGGVTIVVNSPIGRPDDVVRWMREELRRLDRSAR